MPQIVEWLAKLGMSEYAQRFAENGIDIAALRHLTDQDLKEIGVLLGHRRIMLAAIGKLARAAEPVAQPVVGSEARPLDTAERRQDTVMFSDLVGGERRGRRRVAVIPLVNQSKLIRLISYRCRAETRLVYTMFYKQISMRCGPAC
jgi:SAM domain (Sterile alpha motif)